MRALSNRERVLLTLCLVTLFLVANAIGLQAVVRSLRESQSRLRNLETEQREQGIWLAEEEREFQVNRQKWIDAHMPALESAGKAQGQLLEEMQNAAYDLDLELERQTLLEPQLTRFYHEVAVNLSVEGDLDKMKQWLTSLQTPEAFTVIKSLELSLERRSREKEPQAECNITIARWFKPESATTQLTQTP